MKLSEALSLINKAAGYRREVKVHLASGFTPLHLKSFLTAFLQRENLTARIMVETGMFDDLVGNVMRMGQSGSALGVCVMEWPGFDPRLGVRRLSAWSYKDSADVEMQVRTAAARLLGALRGAAEAMSVVVVLPTLPLLPVASTESTQMSALEASLRTTIAGLALELSGNPRIAIVRNDCIVGAPGTFDIESEIAHGFPYTLPHAAAVAEAIARQVPQASRKKGLITDLDETLWKGVIGEIGIENVSWDSEHHAQVHGLYQQLLHWLATEGVLVGVASKNSPEIIERAFKSRPDLLLCASDVFPFEVHWDSKAESVSRILAKWNIGADSVLFIDESPLELAEVKMAHPDIETLRFPAAAAEFFEFWKHLRDVFATTTVRKEDVLRATSLRQDDQLQTQEAWATDRDVFLQQLDAEISFHFCSESSDERAFELVNKTNQFNINGVRYTVADWHAKMDEPGSFLLTCSYADRFGSLGKIAVVQGTLEGKSARVHSWVMSCRAFSRRIEFATLRELMLKFELESIELDYRLTDRNAPVREFLNTLGVVETSPVLIKRAESERACPKLFFHTLTEMGSSRKATNAREG